MKNPHIVVLDAATMRGALLRPTFPHRWTEHQLSNPKEIRTRIKNANIIIVNKVTIGEKDIKAAASLKFIALTATGTNNINLESCKKHGVCVSNIRQYANQGLAEHTISLIYALARGTVSHHNNTLAGQWQDSEIFSPDMGEIYDINGMQIGLIGSGASAQATAALAKKNGMTAVFLKSSRPQRGLTLMPLEKLLKTSDIVSLHCPLTPQNTGMLSTKELALMKPTAFLVNTARGALIDNKALALALKQGRLCGAGIDVLEKEPPPKNHPLLRLKHPRLVITPHVAWASRQSLDNMRHQVRDNLEKFYAGQPQNVVIATKQQ